MAKILKFLVLIGALALTTCAASSNSEAMENYQHLKQNRALTFLGVVEGKAYFMERSASFTWSSAKANCSAQGLVLATIQTTAQRDFLKSKYNITGPGYFWIAARDAQNIDQFVWDQDGKVESNVLSLYNVPSQYTCLCYYITSATSSYFYAAPCSGAGTRYFLCQTY